MTRAASERTRQAVALANRLRLVQVDFADEDVDVREQYLADEIDRALAQVHPDERQAFLSEVQERFPSWDTQVPAAAPAAAPDDGRRRADDRSRVDERELQDPSFLVSRLLALAPDLSSSQRQSIIAQLQQAGLSPAGGGDWPEEMADAVRKVLRLSQETDLDPGRVLELAAVVFAFATSLDVLMWRTWKEIARKSEVRRTVDLQASIGRYVQSGSRDVTGGHPSADVEKLRQMSAAMIEAIRSAGMQYAQRHLAKFSPGAIEQMVIMGGGGRRGRAAPADCWKQYEQLMAGVSRDTLAREINDAVAEFAMQLMRGTGQGLHAGQGSA